MARKVKYLNINNFSNDTTFHFILIVIIKNVLLKLKRSVVLILINLSFMVEQCNRPGINFKVRSYINLHTVMCPLTLSRKRESFI